ncbi:dicarboxylate/amino acid:cation symporter [Tundrisphaera lichenicola]|uniref:dicarboxylate/amino acid:cation symporter n=1 Tax=Tundrisphaera lichenicola TaxID=2029860 RepID=UPI003EBBF459
MKPGPRARFPMVARIVLGIVLGIGVGEWFGPRAEPLAQMGTIILDMIKGLAGPLLLFAILDAFLRTSVPGRGARLMVGISLINATIAIVIGLTLSHVFQPGRSFDLSGSTASSTAQTEFRSMSKYVAPDRTIDFFKDLIGLLPTSILRPIVENSILSMVILAVLGGVALRKVKLEQLARGESGFRPLEDSISTIYRSIEVILSWVIALVPLAVFGVVARTVGLHGFRSFGAVIPYVGVGVLGLLIQILVVYQGWLVLVARIPLRRFWVGAREAIVTAIGTGSSLATLPVTLRSLDRMGVSPQSARMAACVGTNLNNDGILLYEAMAVLFVAQAIGVEMSLGQQLLAAASCVVAGIGISGVPDAGLISLLIVLKTVKLPEAEVAAVIPFLLAVDWVLGRCRSTTNVISDMLVAVLLDKLEPAMEPMASQKDDEPSFVVREQGDSSSSH